MTHAKPEINKKGRSKELSTALELLENAIRDWDGIVVESPESKKTTDLSIRAQGLLKKLRAQIDEFSD